MKTLWEILEMLYMWYLLLELKYSYWVSEGTHSVHNHLWTILHLYCRAVIFSEVWIGQWSDIRIPFEPKTTPPTHTHTLEYNPVAPVTRLYTLMDKSSFISLRKLTELSIISLLSLHTSIHYCTLMPKPVCTPLLFVLRIAEITSFPGPRPL